MENVTGGTRNDTLTGDDTNNVIRGGYGNDTLVGGSGHDELNGERGNDHLDSKDGLTDCTICADGFDVATVDLEDHTAASCETVDAT